jgi:hypothetical protein
LVIVCGVALTLTACHAVAAKNTGSPSPTSMDAREACAALAALRSSGAALNAVDVSDPGASLAALAKAVDAYSAAMLAFELVAPAQLRARAAVVRGEVIAHRFGQAITAQAAIEGWAEQHCTN